MSTDTSNVGADREGRGRIERLLNSPFISDLLSNRLALIGIAIILSMLLVAIYARVFYDFGALQSSRLGGSIPAGCRISRMTSIRSSGIG